MNSPEIIKYARPLNQMAGITPNRIQSEPLRPAEKQEKRKHKGKPVKRPDKVKNIQYEEEIAIALGNYGNEKLISLYYSICTIDLDPHTPIVSVGTWSFFETLTCCAGKAERTSMDAFFSKNRLQAYGFDGDTLAYREAIERIRSYGNTTKHHKISASFNGDQLNNDVATLKNIILKCISEAAAAGK